MKGREMKTPTQTVYGRKIGYLFRFYVEGIINDSKLKLLSVNGVSPNKENIRNNEYPLSDTF